MTPAERDVLRRVRATSTDDLVAVYCGRSHGATIEAEMNDRWLAMAILGELLRRNAVDQLSTA